MKTMERVAFINSRNLTLIGNFYPSVSDAIIIMCHGFRSDKNSKGRFPKLAKAFNDLGHHVLTFDFSGCGESDDDSLTMAKQVEDLKSAISYVKSRGYKRIALYGHSLGSAICLKCFSSEILTMVLSGALTDSMQYNWNDYFTAEQLRDLEEKGQIVEKVEGPRKEVIIDKQMLMDFALLDQTRLLKEVTCPVLIIHGNNDEEEKLLCERSQRAMKFLSSTSKLEIIDGANHSFMDYLDVLSHLASNWFKSHLG